MKTYTVIVGRPDYVSDDPISDTYMTSLQAESPQHAGVNACIEACEQDNPEEDSTGDPKDYVVVAVIEGDHNDVFEPMGELPWPKEDDRPVYEFTLPGFDGGTDATDGDVVWVASTEEELITALGKELASEGLLLDGIEPGDAGVDYWLPDDAEKLKARLEVEDGAAL